METRLTKTSYSKILFLLIFAMILMLSIQPIIRSIKITEITLLPRASIPDLPIVYDAEIANMLNNVVIDPEYSHALEEHPEDALIVRQCLDRRGPYMQFQIQPGRRYLRVCIVDEAKGLIGFQIVDVINKIAKERTAYIREEITNIRQLLEYVKKMGYPRFKGSL